ncbi:hypothetical protein [Absidia glauca]|uniref:Uncharacterized protein n=1 Tax=Absidia glauca TaxID=4829 RepID=A0A168KXN9_ABSGL|nr:hypothetical protein [Absidia glauca]
MSEILTVHKIQAKSEHQFRSLDSFVQVWPEDGSRGDRYNIKTNIPNPTFLLFRKGHICVSTEEQKLGDTTWNSSRNWMDGYMETWTRWIGRMDGWMDEWDRPVWTISILDIMTQHCGNDSDSTWTEQKTKDSTAIQSFYPAAIPMIQ